MKKKKKFLQVIKKRKWVIIPVILVLTAGVAGVFFRMSRSRGMESLAGAMAAQSAQAEKGNISTTVVGTGNLERAEAQNIYIPEGIEVEEVLAESGDYVEEGEVLARLNAASISSEMLSVQEEISDLDEEINEVKDDTESDTVTTKISGKVKKIYAEKGDQVTDVIAEKGALLLLSLDGKMAVELKNATGVVLGDEVEVTLSDGTTVKEGTVASVEGSVCVVTLTDKGTTLGELVSVKDEDGKSLGNGKLTIHQQMEITAVGGTVKSIRVEEGESVEAGETLITLTDLPPSAEYQEMVTKREKLTSRLKTLIQLSETNTLTADFSGTVQDVYVSDNSTAENTEAQSSSGSSSSTAQGAVIGTKAVSATSGTGKTGAVFLNLSTASDKSSSRQEETLAQKQEETEGRSAKTEETVTITSISNVVAAPQTGAEAQTAVTQKECTGTVEWTVNGSAFSGSFGEAAVYTAKVSLQAAEGYAFAADSSLKVTQDGAAGLEWTATEKEVQITMVFSATDIRNCAISLAVPRAGEVPQTIVSETAVYTGTVSWSPQPAVFESGSQYIATVKLTAGEGLQFASSDKISVTLNGNRVSAVSVSEDGTCLTLLMVYEVGADEKDQESQGTEQTNSSGNGQSQSESVQQTNGQQTNGQSGKSPNQSEQSESQKQDTGKTTSISPQTGSTTGSNTGGGSSSYGQSTGTGTTSGSGVTNETSSGDTQSEAEETEDSSVAAFSVSPEETMTLAVSVDELDILSIALDQKAEITFDAIEDETFEGTIAGISDTASVNGGVAKYTVDITMAKTDSMKAGMNASATITIEDKQDILLIPVSALQEQGNRVFVYTEQDSESGALSGEVEVETGLSDGNNVEITSGLSEGDTVYYTRTISSGEDEKEGMGGMMGGGPGGDSMPSGGGSGGFGGGGMPSGGPDRQ